MENLISLSYNHVLILMVFLLILSDIIPVVNSHCTQIIQRYSTWNVSFSLTLQRAITFVVYKMST